MSDQAAVVQGYIKAYKSTADGGSRITIELNEPETLKYHQAFNGINLLVCVARLEDGLEEGSEG